MKCIIYVRTATKQMNAKANSIDRQIESLKEYAEKKGDEILAVFSDAGYSGMNKQRPGLQAVLDLARKEKPDYLLVTSLDRLYRDSKQLFEVYLELQDMNVAIQELSQPERVGLREVLMTAAFASYSRELMSKKIKKGMAWKKQKTA